MNNILVLSPHLDDEFLAAGHYLSQNPASFLLAVFVSHGGGSDELPHIQGNALADWREKETQSFLTAIGHFNKPVFLRLGYPFEIEDKLETIQNTINWYLKNYKLDLILAPHFLDRHGDHAIIGKAVKMLGLSIDVWYYFNSIVAVKSIGRSPDIEIKMTEQEFKLKQQRALIYQSQKHFLPKHLLADHFRSEKFWREK